MCGHRVQFYDSEEFLLRKVLAFLVPAVRQGQSAIVIATEAHAEQLKRLLEKGSFAVTPQELAQFEWLDAHRTLASFMVDGLPQEARFNAFFGALIESASGSGAHKVCAFGEMVALLYAQGNVEAAIQLEQLWHALIQRQSFGLLCAYPMRAFPDDTHRRAFQAICDAHSCVEPLEQVEAYSSQPGELHRLIASLQQKTNSLGQEQLRRGQSDRIVAQQAVRLREMQTYQSELELLVQHDALTGLPNRRALGERLAQALQHAGHAQTRLAVLFIDLDDFKACNDRYGHATGDRLLQEVGSRLLACVRAGDTVCRLDGDEFIVVLDGTDAAEAGALAQRMRESLAQEIEFDQQRFTVTASVGLSLYPDDAVTASALVQRADREMYRAKALKRRRRHDTPKAAESPAGARTNPREVGEAPGECALMTVESTALKLQLSRPHVFKLIEERRFEDVVQRSGAMPLIPSHEVERVALEIRDRKPD